MARILLYSSGKFLGIPLHFIQFDSTSLHVILFQFI